MNERKTWKRFKAFHSFIDSLLLCLALFVMPRCFFLLALLFLITVSTEFVDISCEDTNVKKAINVTTEGGSDTVGCLKENWSFYS